DDRHDIGRAHPRMRTLVPAQVDTLARALDPGDERGDELGPRPDEREHRPVVVAVGMNVEEPRRPGERVADRADDRTVASFGEIRHRLERQHVPYSRSL